MATLSRLFSTLPKKAADYLQYFATGATNPQLNESAFDRSQHSGNELKEAQELSKSRIACQRFLQARVLLEVGAELECEAFINEVMPSILLLSNDAEWSIREELCNQIVSIAAYFIQADPSQGVDRTLVHLLPVATKLFADQNASVRMAACKALIGLSTQMRPRGTYAIVEVVISIANEQSHPHLKCAICPLMNGIAENVGKEACNSFFISQVHCFMEDSDPLVREACIDNILGVWDAAGVHDAINKIFPVYQKASKDNDCRVRISCIRIIAKLCKRLPVKLQEALIGTMDAFLEDSESSVCNSALKNLGGFLAALHRRVPHLLDRFCQASLMNADAEEREAVVGVAVNPSSTNSPSDLPKDVSTALAKDFVNVCSSLGSDGWEDLHSVFEGLVAHPSALIREVMAGALHRIALTWLHATPRYPTLPKEDAEEPIEADVPMDGSTHKSVDASTVNNELNGVLTSSKLCDYKKSTTDRYRTIELAVQNALISFLRDLNGSVKMAALQHLSDVMNCLVDYQSVPLLEMFFEIIKFSDSNWRLRQAVATQLYMVASHDVYYGVKDTLLVELFALLCKDPVADIRRNVVPCVSVLLKRNCAIWDYFEEAIPTNEPPLQLTPFVSTDKIIKEEDPSDESRVDCNLTGFSAVNTTCNDGNLSELISSKSFRTSKSVGSFDTESSISYVPPLCCGKHITLIHRLLKEFAKSYCYVYRQMFIWLCDDIIRHTPIAFFELYFMLPLAGLSIDAVSTVRITWCKMLGRHLKAGGRLQKNALLVSAARLMSLVDKDKIVIGLLQKLQLMEASELQTAKGMDLDDLIL